MTIDIDLLRVERGGDPERVRESERRRFRDPKTVDITIELDQQWIKAQYQTEQRQKEVNAIQRQITDRKKASKGQDKCEDLVGEKTKAEEKVVEQQTVADELKVKRDKALFAIGNLVQDSVPVSKDEDKDNEVVSKWGIPRQFTAKYQTDGFRPHFELLEMIGGVNFEAGHDVAGHRGYFLTGPAVLLNQAFINYGIAFLMREGYTPIQPPYFMNKDVMSQAAELKDYDETLYRIPGHGDGDNDKYMIATAEQPISALYRNKVLAKDEVPQRFVGYSACFRKEAGSSGRDIRGIFRVHQFEKVEQFCIVNAEDSIEEHKKMIKQCEKFYQSLEFPYHVVNIVSGELNDAASKKYDLEAWFPGDDEGKGKYRELVSASNCLDYQTRRMNTRAGFDKDQTVPHMLNSTLCATGRGICCLLENYQTPTGIKVPRVLQPFMCGMEFIPFVKPAPGSKEGKKKDDKKKGGKK